MMKKLSIISSGYNIVWLAYTLHYIVLFSILTSDFFEVANLLTIAATLLPLNIIMNSVSIILAVIGVIISHQASRANKGYWGTINLIIHALMIVWIFGGSFWVLFLML